MPSSEPGAARIDSCQALVVSYLDWPLPDPAWSLRLDAASGGALYFFGAEHSRDPAHPQFEAIRDAFHRFRPTVVFYEGPERPLGDTEEQTIRQYGESGFVRYLAAQDSLHVARLEPDPRAELRYVVERFSAEQAGLFFVLREAARLREREGLDEDALNAAVAQLLQRAASLFDASEMVITSTEELQALYRNYWNDPPQWWQAPSTWFDPLGLAEETGGQFMHAVNRASSTFRNRHMVQVLGATVRKGERVFAVVGRNHVPMQAPALRCALE